MWTRIGLAQVFIQETTKWPNPKKQLHMEKNKIEKDYTAFLQANIWFVIS